MKINQLKQLEDLLIITKDGFRLYEKNENNLSSNLKYWVKKGELIRLKKGRYILKSRWQNEYRKEDYLEFLANKIYEPSYLSCEYVMNKYNLLTESVYSVTSITTKKTKVFKNQLATYVYYSITPNLFFDFYLKKSDLAPILIAKKSKAVFDFLYLRFLKNTPINKKVIIELRINWENINKKEFLEIKRYADKSKNKRVIQVINLISKIYYA